MRVALISCYKFEVHFLFYMLFVKSVTIDNLNELIPLFVTYFLYILDINFQNNLSKV